MIFAKRHAFTLVEILIVVVILGILAAIVIPMFATASDDARKNATLTDLQKIRRHIGVYRARNSMNLPAITEGDGSWGEIISRDYLLSAPINSWVGGSNSKLIKFGTGPDATFQNAYGWIYDQTTGEVWAAGYDNHDEALPRP